MRYQHQTMLHRHQITQQGKRHLLNKTVSLPLSSLRLLLQHRQRGVSNFERQVIDLTNAQRKKNGLPALQMDTALSKVAKTKANDMQQKNYFSHTSPTYGSPFDMMRDFGVSYKTAGENIAKGQTSPEAVVNAWMNSEGHRKNILNANFTHIGVGHQASGNYWSQMFIGK